MSDVGTCKPLNPSATQKRGYVGDTYLRRSDSNFIFAAQRCYSSTIIFRRSMDGGQR
jgi:hypothetical protein